ncbi:MAG: hypothetical protein ABRQ38_00590 [Candidatus Eremiobacterota bacterium]
MKTVILMIEDNRCFLEDGMHFLQKPYSMKTLADKLHELLEIEIK